MQTLESLVKSTQTEISSEAEVRAAYLLGMHWKAFEGLEEESFQPSYDFESWQFNCDIFADSPNSWHEAYRALRNRGWERMQAYREGGTLTYFLSHEDENLPVPEIFMRFRVTFSTCKQVQVGTREVPVYETRCEVESDDGEEIPSKKEIPADDIPF